MDLTKLSLLELKALGFDIQNQIALLQNNLNVLHGELNKRSEAPLPEPGSQAADVTHAVATAQEAVAAAQEKPIEPETV